LRRVRGDDERPPLHSTFGPEDRNWRLPDPGLIGEEVRVEPIHVRQCDSLMREQPSNYVRIVSGDVRDVLELTQTLELSTNAAILDQFLFELLIETNPQLLCLLQDRRPHRSPPLRSLVEANDPRDGDPVLGVPDQPASRLADHSPNSFRS